MTDLRQGVSATTQGILDMADAIMATDHLMPAEGKMRSFDRAQRILAEAANGNCPDRYRRGNVTLAAAILIAIANGMHAEMEGRTAELFGQLGYRP